MESPHGLNFKLKHMFWVFLTFYNLICDFHQGSPYPGNFWPLYLLWNFLGRKKWILSEQSFQTKDIEVTHGLVFRKEANWEPRESIQSEGKNPVQRNHDWSPWLWAVSSLTYFPRSIPQLSGLFLNNAKGIFISIKYRSFDILFSPWFYQCSDPYIFLIHIACSQCCMFSVSYSCGHQTASSSFLHWDLFSSLPWCWKVSAVPSLLPDSYILLIKSLPSPRHWPLRLLVGAFWMLELLSHR